MIKLDKDQRKAVMSKSKHILICAGPGSGKTRTLISRIIHLLETDVYPKDILVLTFTNKSAAEIQERIRSILKPDSKIIPYIGTIHSLCLKILKSEINRIKDFIVINDRDRRDIIKKIKSKLNIKLTIKDLISMLDIHDQKSKIDLQAYTKFQKEYDRFLKSHKMLDYKQILTYTKNLLYKNEIIRTKYQNIYKHILIDEYQDIDPIQNDILRTLVKPKNSLFAIGDADQSIYGFRGADIRNFINFKKQYPKADIIKLKHNYRSSTIIVKASKSFINHNTKRIPIEYNSAGVLGSCISIVSCNTDKDEAKFISTEIEKCMGGTSLVHTDSYDDLADSDIYNFSDFAVLYRTNNFARFIEQELSFKGIPYQAIGKNPLWENKLTVDFLNILNFTITNNSYYKNKLIKSKFTNFISTNFKNAEEILNYLKKYHLKYKSFDEIFSKLENIIGKIDYQTLIELEHKLSLYSKETFIDKKSNCVYLLTIHQSKGLEFQNVFIAGVEDGTIPLVAKNKGITDMEEERRLFYVGMTRACRSLTLTWARKRRIWGLLKINKSSRFLHEIDSNYVSNSHFGRKWVKKPQIKMF